MTLQGNSIGSIVSDWRVGRTKLRGSSLSGDVFLCSAINFLQASYSGNWMATWQTPMSEGSRPLQQTRVSHCLQNRALLRDSVCKREQPRKSAAESSMAYLLQNTLQTSFPFPRTPPPVQPCNALLLCYAPQCIKCAFVQWSLSPDRAAHS